MGVGEIGTDTSVLSPVTVEEVAVNLGRSFSIWEASLVMMGSWMLRCLGS